jgi:hypothetical protein
MPGKTTPWPKRGERMRVTIDRLESGYAIVELEDGTFVTVPASLFPGAKEGDVFRIELDPEAMEERKQLIHDLQNKLRNRERKKEKE